METINATGQYIIGDGNEENIFVAKQKAREDAKRRASEMAGVYVKSYSRVVNLKLVEDEVQTISSQILKVLKEDIRYSNTSDGMVMIITCSLVAEVDTDNILFEGKEKAEMVLAEKNKEESKASSDVLPLANTKVEKTEIEVVKPDPDKTVAAAEKIIPEKFETVAVSIEPVKTENVLINSNVSVKSQVVYETPLEKIDFIKKPADYAYDKVTNILKRGSVKYVPNTQNWICVGKYDIPYYSSRDEFIRYADGMVWISPETIMRRGNKLRFPVARFDKEKNIYRINTYLVNYDKEFQIILDGYDYDASTGKYLGASTGRAKGVPVRFDENGPRKTMLMNKVMEKYLK